MLPADRIQEGNCYRLTDNTGRKYIARVDKIAEPPPRHTDPTAEEFVLTIPVVRFYWRVDAASTNWSPLVEQLQLGSFAGCAVMEVPCE